MPEMRASIPTRTFNPSRLSAIGLLLACGTFAAIGILTVINGNWPGYFMAALSGVGMTIAVIQLVPGSAYLHVAPVGFTTCTLWRRSTVAWSNIDRFFVITHRHSGIKVQEIVGYNYVATYDRARVVREMSKCFNQCDNALPQTYGMTARALAEFMNDCLARAK